MYANHLPQLTRRRKRRRRMEGRGRGDCDGGDVGEGKTMNGRKTRTRRGEWTSKRMRWRRKGRVVVMVVILKK